MSVQGDNDHRGISPEWGTPPSTEVGHRARRSAVWVLHGRMASFSEGFIGEQSRSHTCGGTYCDSGQHLSLYWIQEDRGCYFGCSWQEYRVAKKDVTVINRLCVLGAMARVDNGHFEQFEIFSHTGRSKASRCHYHELENQCGESARNFDGLRR